MPIILRKHLRFIAIVAIGIFGLALSAQARENNLAISGTTILPGQTATIAVNLHNTDNCYGLQFDITMPEGLSLTGVSKTNRTSNCVLTPNLNSGKERVVLLSLSNPLSGSYGDVCELKVQASPTFKGGILKITNAKMSDGGTSDITIPSTQCEFLNVKNATVILPDFSITAGESKYVGVNIKAEGNVAGLQVDLYLPNELTIDLSSIALSSSGSNFILDKQQHNGYIRVLIYSLSNAVISGNLDDVFSFAVKADESASGITEIKLQNISISSQTGVNIPLESSRTKVTINKPRASSITLSPASAILKVGEQQQIAATIFPENAANKELFWSIDNPAIATVDETGLVHAIGLGTAIITATSKDDTEIKATCQITVVATPAGSIILNKTEATLKATETLDLVATILPETITDKSVTWISSNEAIATVDANGKVTAMAVGKTTITVTAASGVSAKCAITVVETPAGGIIIDKDALGITGDNLEMRVGDVKAIKVTVTPETTTDKSVTYESSNPTVASVDENGNVTALSLGTSAITITAKSNPEVKATINVTVVATPAGSITLNKTETTLKATETVDLVATILPETTTDKSVTWKSSDETIATVDANGKVTAVAVGKATITATATTGIEATCAITVVATPAESIALNCEDATIRVNDTVVLNASIAPEQTTDKIVVWKSSDENIASVDANGVVRGLYSGVATITATAASGVSASCTVTVFPRETAPITVTRSNEKIIIMDGESAEMSVNITGGYPEGLIFAWSNGGNTVGSANSLTVVGRSNGNKKSNEFYRVHVVDVCDGVTLLDETYQFEVETWPLPATDVAIETDSDTDNLKIREGNLLELSAENPPGGYADNWGFDWYLDGTIISSEPEMSRLMTMYEDTEMATEKAVVTLIASNIGPDGTVWGEATSAPLNVTIYRRPLTPKQLLRKGDGTTHTVVAMSQYADTDLARLGYTFVYGYTDADGEDHVVATTVKRYCRLDKAIFDNVDCEKWCYSQWTYDDGSVVSSGKRYLDGRADENFDRSDFSGSANPKKSIDFSDSNNWIRSNGKNINISIETTDEARVDVYSIAGTLIDSVEIPADTFMSVDYTSDRLAPNFYIISVTTADKRVVKKVFIK